MGKNISKNLNGKCSQKRLDHAKKSAKNALKTSSIRVIQKTAERSGDLIGKNIAKKSTRVSKNSQQNNPETVRNEDDKEIRKERYMSPKEIQKNINRLRLI